jgi:hypothetical protein
MNLPPIELPPLPDWAMRGAVVYANEMMAYAKRAVENDRERIVIAIARHERELEKERSSRSKAG